VKAEIYELTVKAGYNASHLRNKGIRVYQVKPDVADLPASGRLCHRGLRPICALA